MESVSFPENRTNVRLFTLRVLLDLAVHLERLAPVSASRLAARLFFSPQHRTRPAREVEALKDARPSSFLLSGRRIAVWEWGEGSDAILLVHGWSGRGAQLHAFVPPLVAQGWRVIAFDAPAHGASQGHESSVFDFASAIRQLVAQDSGIVTALAHSLGGVAVLLALRAGIRLRRAVLLGTTADPALHFERFASALRLPPGLTLRARREAEGHTGHPWSELRLRSGPCPSIPLLLFHDRDDSEVSFADALTLAAAWPSARLVATAGLGHRRILRDPYVVAQASEFLGAPCGVSGLEDDLYGREARRERIFTSAPG